MVVVVVVVVDAPPPEPPPEPNVETVGPHAAAAAQTTKIAREPSFVTCVMAIVKARGMPSKRAVFVRIVCQAVPQRAVTARLGAWP